MHLYVSFSIHNSHIALCCFAVLCWFAAVLSLFILVDQKKAGNFQIFNKKAPLSYIIVIPKFTSHETSLLKNENGSSAASSRK